MAKRRIASKSQTQVLCTAQLTHTLQAAQLKGCRQINLLAHHSLAFPRKLFHFSPKVETLFCVQSQQQTIGRYFPTQWEKIQKQKQPSRQQ